MGDDWGDLRTAEHRNSWDADNPDADQSAQTGFFDFITDRTVSGHPSPNSAQNDGSAYDSRYVDDDLDRGWENFDDNVEGYQDGYQQEPVDGQDRRVYNDGLYGDEYGNPSGEPAYSDSEIAEGPESGYDVRYEEGFEEGFEEEGVYEADYRVIVPPSKPLDDDEAY